MDKVILKSRDVRRESSPALERVHLLQQGAKAEVRTVSEGGVLRAIEVVCTCGDVITVDLDVADRRGGPDGGSGSDSAGE